MPTTTTVFVVEKQKSLEINDELTTTIQSTKTTINDRLFVFTTTKSVKKYFKFE